MITELSKIKNYLKINGNDFDDLLYNLSLSAEKQLTNYLNQNIEQTTVSIILNGSGTRLLLIPSYHNITAFSAIYYRNTLSDSFVSQTLSDYTLVKIENIDYIYTNSVFIAGLANYKITITYGYGTDSIPDDIKHVLKEIIAVNFKKSDLGGGIKGGNLGLNSISESVNGVNYNTSFKDLFTTEHKFILDKYKRIVI